MCECYQIGGRFIAEDPDCPVHDNGHGSCECHQIGGKYIAEDPECPIHGINADIDDEDEAQPPPESFEVLQEKLKAIYEN